MSTPAGNGRRPFPHRNLLGISQLNQYEIVDLIDRGAPAAEIEAAVRAHRDHTIGALHDYQTSHQHHDLAAIAAE